MKLVHVIPIVKGIQKDQLSYFSVKNIPDGTLVSIPLRNKQVRAIVIDSEDARHAKSQLKTNDFALKKIDSRATHNVFLPAFIKATKRAADFFATTQGAVLHQVIPHILIENAHKLESKHTLLKENKGERSKTSSEIFAFQSAEKTRFDDYKKLVREAFVRKHSTYIMIPTIAIAERLATEIQKGIESYVFILHSNVPKKELLKRIIAIKNHPHPVLIIGTGGFLAVPRPDIKTIIVERENARSYKRQSRPYIDYRIFAQLYAKELGVRIIYADMPLSIETMWRLKQREFEEVTSNRIRLATDADQYIIDMRPDTETKKFFILSTQLTETIDATTDKDERTFIFSVRRGIAPTTVCEDCGSIVTCAMCNAPVVLHTSPSGNVFVCHSCGSVRDAKERCKTCKSWKLKMLGIGGERIKKELVERFGAKRVFAIDSDSVKNYGQAKKITEQFYNTKGAILVGTELSLSFIDMPVTHSVIASIDSLLLLPDPKMYEHIFSTILKVRAYATDSFLLQTRQPALPLITEALEGNVMKFFEGEILNRKRFEYPPFTILIKITVCGGVESVEKEMEHIEKLFEGYTFHIYPALTRTTKNKYALNGLLKIPVETWPDKKLLTILRSLPPHININVSPASTL